MPRGKENARDLLRVRTHTHADTRTCTRKHTGGLRLVGGAPGEGFSRPDLLLPDLGLHKSVPQFPWIKKGGAPAPAGAPNTPKTGVLRGFPQAASRKERRPPPASWPVPGVLPERSVRSLVTDQVLALINTSSRGPTTRGPGHWSQPWSQKARVECGHVRS